MKKNLNFNNIKSVANIRNNHTSTSLYFKEEGTVTNPTPSGLSGGLLKTNKTYKANLTPLVTVPIQNRQTLYKIQDSTLPSLINYNNKLNTLKKEQRKGVKERAVTVLKESTILTQYIQNSLSIKKSNPLIPSETTKKEVSVLLSAGADSTLNTQSNSESFNLPLIGTTQILNLKNKTESFTTFEPNLDEINY